jgi:hypothetical protein
MISFATSPKEVLRSRRGFALPFGTPHAYEEPDIAICQPSRTCRSHP